MTETVFGIFRPAYFNSLPPIILPVFPILWYNQHIKMIMISFSPGNDLKGKLLGP